MKLAIAFVGGVALTLIVIWVFGRGFALGAGARTQSPEGATRDADDGDDDDESGVVGLRPPRQSSLSLRDRLAPVRPIRPVTEVEGEIGGIE